MRRLITTDLYSVSTNGVVTSVNNPCDELRSKGHDVRILTLSWNRSSFVQDGVYYIRFFSLDRIYQQLRGSLAVFDRLFNELIEWKPDVIHSQCEFFTFRFARHISKRTDSPIVHTYHTLYENYVGYMNGYGIKQNIAIIPSGIALEQHQQVKHRGLSMLKLQRTAFPSSAGKLLAYRASLQTERMDSCLKHGRSSKQPFHVSKIIIPSGARLQIAAGILPPTLIKDILPMQLNCVYQSVIKTASLYPEDSFQRVQQYEH